MRALCGSGGKVLMNGWSVRIAVVFLWAGLYVIAVSCGTTVEPTENDSSVEAAAGSEKQAKDGSALREVSLESGRETAVERSAEVTKESLQEKPPAKEGTGSSRPNILLIILDDYGVDSTKSYQPPNDGRDYAATPNLDGICKAGVQFQNAWSTPLCSSTRATMLTGRHGFRTGIGEAIPRGQGIDSKEPTLPRILDANKALGYAHANLGKWHLGTTQVLGNLKAPNTMGWSFFSGVLSGSLADYSQWNKITNGASSSVTTYATTENVKDTIAWIEKQDRDKPWFVWLAFNAPHDPLHLPPKELHNVPGLSGTTRDIRQNPNGYFRAMVEAIDFEVGKLLDWLKSKQMFDNTVILYIGDNGTQARAVLPPYDRRRSKGSIYQNGIHVPYCISGPIVSEGGRKSDALVHTVDLFSTILAIAGVDTKNDLPSGFAYDSVSLVPLLKDAKATFSRDWNLSYRFAWGKNKEGNQAIRNKTYKLVRLRNTQGAITDELYNLNKDPLEKTNILAKGQSGVTEEEKKNYNALVTKLEALLQTK